MCGWGGGAFRIGFYGVFADSRLSAHAGFDLHFSFSSVRGWGGGLRTSMWMRLVSSVSFVASYVCVCRISHRFLPCFCRLSTFCTCQLRLAFVFQLCERVGMGWGVGGVTTSMRIRLVSSVSFVASYVCVCVCRISRRFLTCFCRLSTFCTCQLRLAFVFQLCERVGMGWGVGGVTTSMRIRFASSVSFVASCVCVCVAFRIGFYRVFADSRLSAHASLDLHLSFSSVRGWGWGGGWEG